MADDISGNDTGAEPTIQPAVEEISSQEFKINKLLAIQVRT